MSSSLHWGSRLLSGDVNTFRSIGKKKDGVCIFDTAPLGLAVQNSEPWTLTLKAGIASGSSETM